MKKTSRLSKIKMLVLGHGLKEGLMKIESVRNKAELDIRDIIADISLFDDQWLLVPKKEVNSMKKSKKGGCDDG